MSQALSSPASVPSARSVLGEFGERLVLIGMFAIPLLADLFAQSPYYGLQTHLYPSTAFAAAVVTGFLLLLLFVTPSFELITVMGGKWQRRGLMLLCLIPAALTLKFMGGVPSLAVWVILGILALVYLGLLVYNPASLLWFFLLALVYSFIQRARFFNVVPLTAQFSDILPIIVLASKNFLAGQPVYVIYHMPWTLPMAYLPVTWLSYVPAVAAGLDVRWVNLAAEFGIVLVLLSVLYPERQVQAVNAVFGLAAFIFLLPTFIYWDAFTSHQIWWFWLVLSLRLLMARRYALWSVTSGIALAASQLSIVVLPVLGLFILRAVPLRRAVLYLGGLVAVFALILLPFAARDPRTFFDYTVVFYSDLHNYAVVMWDNNQRVLNVLGLGGAAWLYGWQDRFKFIQGGIILLLGAIYTFLFRNTIPNVLRVASVTLGLFLLASPIIWEYYYQALFFVMLLYLASLAIPVRNARFKPSIPASTEVA